MQDIFCILNKLGSVTFWRIIIYIPGICPTKQGGRQLRTFLPWRREKKIFLKKLKIFSSVYSVCFNGL